MRGYRDRRHSRAFSTQAADDVAGGKMRLVAEGELMQFRSDAEKRSHRHAVEQDGAPAQRGRGASRCNAVASGSEKVVSNTRASGDCRR